MPAILFVRRDSVYKSIAGCDCWDVDRDARLWPGGEAVVAHPPCRTWGNMAHFAKAPPWEKHLAVLAVDFVRMYGGVLEHPAYSRLWQAQRMPRPGEPPDGWGGYTILVEQCWFGHRARKRTWLYIVGVEPQRLPEWTISIKPHDRGLCSSHAKFMVRLPQMGRTGREQTPPRLARWLVAIAELAER